MSAATQHVSKAHRQKISFSELFYGFGGKAIHSSIRSYFAGPALLRLPQLSNSRTCKAGGRGGGRSNPWKE